MAIDGNATMSDCSEVRSVQKWSCRLNYVCMPSTLNRSRTRISD